MTKEEFKHLVEQATGTTITEELGHNGYRIGLDSVDAILFVDAFNKKFNTDYHLSDHCIFKKHVLLRSSGFGAHYISVYVPMPKIEINEL